MATIESYQLMSGYLGVNKLVLTLNTDTNFSTKQLTASVINKNIPNREPEFFYNRTIEKLFAEYEAKPAVVGNFEYQESLITTFFELFKDTSFVSWLALQMNTPFYTNLHESYLEDTVKFILTGSRSISVLTWGRMIKLDESSLMERNRSILQTKMQDISNEELISKWLSTSSEGVVDLLFFLKIVFGKQV